VSAARTGERLLRFYPSAWRRRYGEELKELIVEASERGGVSWRTRLDVALAGSRERVRAAGLEADGAPTNRVRARVLLVLCAWAVFVLGGMVVGKFSEHWQGAVPASGGSVGRLAFTILVGAACCGSALVLAGAAVVVPSFLRFVRGGGWRRVRRPLARTVAVVLVLVAATSVLAIWAGSLDARHREGGDLVYSIGFVAWALLVAATIATATMAAIEITRKVELAPSVLRVLAWIGAGTALAMAVVTAATVVWWIELAGTAPWFFSGRDAGQGGSALAPQLIVATAVMVVATLAAGRNSIHGLAEARTSI
jgi:hypothetical protein